MSEHFKPKEFASKDGAPSPWPEEVDPDLYLLLEEIRADFGEPIYINSGYRSPEHNKKVGGVIMSEDKRQTLDRRDIVIRRNGKQLWVV